MNSEKTKKMKRKPIRKNKEMKQLPSMFGADTKMSMDIGKEISKITEKEVEKFMKTDPSTVLKFVIQRFPLKGEERETAISKGIEKAQKLNDQLFGPQNLIRQKLNVPEWFCNLIALDYLTRLTAQQLQLGMKIVGIDIEKLSEKDNLKTQNDVRGYA